MAELMVEALGSARDRNAVLVRFAEVVSAKEALVLREALDAVVKREQRVPEMSLYVAAGLLAAIAFVLVGPLSVWLARGHHGSLAHPEPQWPSGSRWGSARLWRRSERAFASLLSGSTPASLVD